jgi:hypothetical protein
MRRICVFCLAAFLCPLAIASAHSPDVFERFAEITPFHEFNRFLTRSVKELQSYNKLQKPVTMFPAEHLAMSKEFRETGKLTVKDALEYFSDETDLTLIIDDSLFEKVSIKDIEEKKVVIRSMRAPAADCLSEILNQIGAEYRIKRDYIPIVPRSKSSVWRLFRIEPKSEKCAALRPLSRKPRRMCRYTIVAPAFAPAC